jgi:TonB family protein
MHAKLFTLSLCLLPLQSCQLLPAAHGEPIELEMDTGSAPQATTAQPFPWPAETRIDTQTGRFELTWDATDPLNSTESIPLDAILQVELARAWDSFPDELYLHLVNSRRILISRGDQVSTQVAVLTAWLDRPVTELPAGQGHQEWEGELRQEAPRLIVNTTGGMLDIQPIDDSATVDSSSNEEASTGSASSGSSSSGRAHSEDIDRTIKTHMTRFRSCYQRQLQRNPRLEGRVVMQITIDASGSVSSAELAESSLSDSVVEKCIADELLRLEFPPPRGGRVVISYPFAFSRS